MLHALNAPSATKSLLGLAIIAVAAFGGSAAAAPTPRLPARLITCSLGHTTNFDPNKQQTVADITYDTHHRLTVFLPSIAPRKTPPPDATEPAEVVDPATRVIEDPDGITADAPGPFDRVVDLWPERVELAKTTPVGTFKTLLVSDYDPAQGKARMFLGTATDLLNYDLSRIYMGECTVELDPVRKPGKHRT